jgi:GT2 family glycosyltransferase
VPISVIVPTHERPDQLAHCLDLVARQAVAPDSVEVIVTDDSRDSRTRDLIAEKYPRFTWVAGPRRGPAANRNSGAHGAKGEWLVFVDDDCEPQPGWLAALIAATSDHDVVEGRTLAPGATDSPFEEHVENPSGDNFWSCNLAVRRSVFEELGGFDEDFLEAGGEDMEFAWRIRQLKLRTVFAPEAEVIHPVRRISWPQLWRRTLMIRWMLLYRLKTGDAQPLDASALRVSVALLVREVTESLRVVAQLFTRPDPQRPRTQCFHALKRILTFPVVLPWLFVWEFRFRRQLAARMKRKA